MTLFMSTLILFLVSIATGIFAFGGFHEPAPSVAVVLFIAFTALLAMSATVEYRDYRSHHPRAH
jgi:uncharacterized membrane protein YtjA (UPF0391 family)